MLASTTNADTVSLTVRGSIDIHAPDVGESTLDLIVADITTFVDLPEHMHPAATSPDEVRGPLPSSESRN